MKIHIKKISEGIIDTDRERRRIKNSFKDDAVAQRKLTELIDAVELMDWSLARKLLESKWWQGDDKELGCPRVEFLGNLGTMDIYNPDIPASGFDFWASYGDLIIAMTEPETSKRYSAKLILVPVLK